MKNLAIIIAIFAMGMNVIGQTTDTIINAPADSTKVQLVGSAEVQIASVNMLPMTGLALEKDAASINGNIYIGADYDKFGIGLTVISQKSVNGSQTTYNLIDITGSYRPMDNLTITAGYEQTYWDHPEGNDEIGHNFLAIANYNISRVSITGIVLVDKDFSSVYLIGSASYKATDHIDVVGLYGYANTMGSYGMLAVKYTYQRFNCGVYGLINKNPGIGVTASFKVF